ncbi:Pls/PosA family non-ribosomal peptide synthetase [Halioxenophilus aromaticivorans]|uniref:Non-ribosomal peptide synthetase n=1 Tax=Halioxenophilus aromaticivorans TaxID=1306992 RepID=A0AAV3U0F0_9ALTE
MTSLNQFDAEMATRGLLVQTDFNNHSRWQPGLRMHHLFETKVDEFIGSGQSDHLAVDSQEGCLTYPQLDARANQLAHWLMQQGYGPGDVIALLLDKSAWSYIAMLAVQKIHAAYVPLDPSFPQDRIDFIVEDAKVRLLLTQKQFGEPLTELDIAVIALDDISQALAQCSSLRPALANAACDSQLAYIIYTSGSTGKPKGVPISQANIVNFIAVACEVYGYQSNDRVYQGLTIAFDFAVEEIWVPLAVGATLLPNQTGSSLLGDDLHTFLQTNQATAMCCVPTLLQTIDQDLPALRLLIVSGEACPRDLIERWWSPQRAILNAYGPTETTVTATLKFSQPGEAVTIGKPLPTYTVLVLDPDTQALLPMGQEGEICVAGIGLAQGYLNRPEQTAKAFIPDHINVPNNPSGMIYRTGDLGAINPRGDVEYRGRIDLQVKVRGYRIELTEIESTLLRLPGIGQAVVDTFEPMPGAKELVAYYTAGNGDAPPCQDEIVAFLRAELPAYMVPAYYEPLATIPMLSSDKANRKALPKPQGQRMNAGNRVHVEASTELEREICHALAELLQLDKVSVQDHFFDDLGATSLLMAKLGATLRARLPQHAIAIKDFYTSPTVAALAETLNSSQADANLGVHQEAWYTPGRIAYWLCGCAQMAVYLTVMVATVALGWPVIGWVTEADSAVGVFTRTAAAGSATFIGWTAFSVAAKWLLIGRWQQQQIPLWSRQYFRFWLARLLVQMSPMLMFRGTPLYNVYLRMLGARIGNNVVIECREMPLCTDLIAIGDHTVVRQDSILATYKARSNRLITGTIELGSNVVVGEGSVLDINTRMGDNAQLAHASCLLEGQAICANASYHGNPASPTESNFRYGGSEQVSRSRLVLYSLSQLILPFWILTPAFVVVLWWFASWLALPQFENLSATSFITLFDEVAVLFFGTLIAGLASTFCFTRIANRFIKPGKQYVMYGVHYAVARYIKRVSNIPFYTTLFGDSSYVTTYMQWLGYKLGKVFQTGSNFGVNQQQDNPLLCSIGERTMVSDGLKILNLQESSTAFCLQPVNIGRDLFMGNALYYPAEAQVGNNCLLATKVMLPIDGKIKENTGLLGSPSFEIPRAVESAEGIETASESRLREQRLGAKNRHNIISMLLFLGSNLVAMYGTVVIASVAAVVDNMYGAGVWLLALMAELAFTLAWFIFVERAALGFGRMQPMLVSIYDPRYWSVERYWKLSETPLKRMWKGTPMRNLLNRALGIKVGKMVFDDGVGISEKTLVEYGDYCNLNAHSFMQSHSLEDGIFKSDHIKVGHQCVLDVQAFLHYGVRTENNILAGADAFVMKGETLTHQTAWRGNPAEPIALLNEQAAQYQHRELKKPKATLTDVSVPPPPKETDLVARTALDG